MSKTDTVKYSKKLDVRSIAVSDLKPAKYNPRDIDNASLEALEASIRDFGQRENLIVNKDMTVISGHMRLRVMKKLGFTEASCDVVELSKDDEKKLNLIMNSPKLQGVFDQIKVDKLLEELKLSTDLDFYRLPELGSLHQGGEGEPDPKAQQEAHDKLADKFLVPPFSIIDTRQETWQERKRTWLALGIKSEVGRGEDLTLKSTGFLKDEIAKRGGGTSVFDPALTEVMYQWFNVEGGAVLDPFAGGSVRGVVAHKTGMPYTGIELRDEQVAANRDNAKQIFGKNPVQLSPSISWLEGDSNVLLHDLNQDYDFIFSCPPYADLEVYSDNKADISNMAYGEFLKAYSSIIETAVSKLKDNRFACFVVSEVRSPGYGPYYNFVADTIQAFINAGMHYYNEIILINPAGTVPIRAGRQFNGSRKVGRTHQNVLVFYKGNHKDIGKNFGEIDLREALADDSNVVEL